MSYFYYWGMSMSIDKKLIGQKIKEYRKRKRLSQAQLAEKINISDKHMGRIEAGKYLPGIENFLNIISVLEIDINDFGIYSPKVENSNLAQLLELIRSSSEKEISAYLKILKVFKEISIV